MKFGQILSVMNSSTGLRLTLSLGFWCRAPTAAGKCDGVVAAWVSVAVHVDLFQ